MGFFKRFLRDEGGLETVEYAVVTGLISLAAIAAIALLAANVTTAFLGLGNRIK